MKLNDLITVEVTRIRERRKEVGKSVGLQGGGYIDEP